MAHHSKHTLLYTHLLIHLFAFAHVLTVWGFYMLGWSDEYLLTCLTISMIVLVGRIHRFPLDLSAVMALLFCFAAFFMGTKGAEWLAPLAEQWGQVVPNMISTCVITEILGWSTWLIATRSDMDKTPQEEE